ncbi:MAG: DnaJ domain-containing protein [Myxococcota bacterium]
MEPKRLKNWLIAFALLYLLFPRDLIPDFFGRGLGLIDDLALMAALVWFYHRRLRELAARGGAESARAGAETRREPAKRSERAFDPYQILGVSASSSQEAIRNAYRARMREYHPDKVAHLGEELQELAHRKALEIQEAYRLLTK